MKRSPTIRISHPTFATGEALTLLYPELATLLHTIPSQVEGEVRMYNAFIALDVVNSLRQPISSEVDESDEQP